ncbi:MAG: hypothetical protein JXA20_10240 [Spirochaetes bacterium]|nr:hypothetical protein [Spirochaetota bacterium]
MKVQRGSGRIAAVGPRSRIRAFEALGARIFATEDIEEARGAIERFAAEGCPLILVPDDMLARLPDLLAAYASAALPAITALPDPRGETPFSNASIDGIVRKAIGIQIMG